MNDQAIVLPPAIVTKRDVALIINEFESVDNELTAAEVRAHAGAESQAAPVLSARLAEFIDRNAIELGNAKLRSELVERLRHMKENLPILHLTFAVDADRESLEALAEWTRNEIDAHAVLDIGVQPALIAGVYIRTPNHVHDLSLRGVLKQRRGALVRELEGLRAGR